jgi:hypothetical protein
MTDEEKLELLKFWMKENERGPSWVARKAGYTQAYISRILSGRDRFTSRLEKTLENSIGIDFSVDSERCDEK